MQRLRGATGALVLSTALLIGSGAGAIATAETGTGDPTPRSSRTPDTTDRGSGASGRQSPSTSVRDAVRSAASAVESHLDRVPSSEEAESRSSATDDDAAGTVGSDESDAAVEDAVVVDADPADEQPVPAVPTTVPEPAPPVAETPTPVEPVTGPDVTEAAPSTAGGRDGGTYDGFDSSTSPDPGAAASGPDSLDEPAGDDEPPPVEPRPIIRVVTTMTTVVVSLGNAVAAVPPVILALPFSSTPFPTSSRCSRRFWRR
ncbi:MAG: hypothetical protein U1D00_34955 [Mycobacterium sp.]|nr:hypothetical protein [Mycobacterium sp.]